MSNTFFKINGYVSATTTIVNSWFLLPLKTIEIADPAVPDANILETISSCITIISLGTALTYQYDKYVKIDTYPKWLTYSTCVVFGLLFYRIIKHPVNADIYSTTRTRMVKYVIPLGYVLIGAWHTIDMIGNCKRASAYRILFTINAFLNLADFMLIHEPMKTQPQIYYPVHGIRVLLKNAEGATLLAEIVGTEEGPGTQPA